MPLTRKPSNLLMREVDASALLLARKSNISGWVAENSPVLHRLIEDRGKHTVGTQNRCRALIFRHPRHPRLHLAVPDPAERSRTPLLLDVHAPCRLERPVRRGLHDMLSVFQEHLTEVAHGHPRIGGVNEIPARLRDLHLSKPLLSVTLTLKPALLRLLIVGTTVDDPVALLPQRRLVREDATHRPT